MFWMSTEAGTLRSKGRFQTNKELSHSYSKNRVSPKGMTFLTLEVSEQKFKQSLGRDLGNEIYNSSNSLFKMNFKVPSNSNTMCLEGLISLQI